MVVLKIIGIILATIILLIGLILLVKTKLFVSFSKEKGFDVGFRVLFFKKTLTAKKHKAKKQSRLGQKIKQWLGLDVFDKEELKKDVENGTISETVTQIITIVMLFFDRIKWLLSKLRVDKLKINAVCGGDSAEAAMEYGLVCASVYPLTAFVTNNINIKKNAEEISIFCNFDGETYLEFDLKISVRNFHLLKAALGCLTDLAVIAQQTEDLNNERR